MAGRRLFVLVAVSMLVLAATIALALGSSASEPRSSDLPSMVTTRTAAVADSPPVAPAPASAPATATATTASATSVPAAAPLASPPATVRPAGAREIVEPAVRESDDGASAKGRSGD